MDAEDVDIAIKISIHALREEGDQTEPKGNNRGRISIHALREEGDTTATR